MDQTVHSTLQIFHGLADLKAEKKHQSSSHRWSTHQVAAHPDRNADPDEPLWRTRPPPLREF
jgi:hypothetical protein